jgi:hypothetical protein
MHFLLEGVAPWELRLLLRAFVKDKMSSLQTLNERIQDFDYGYLDRKATPSQISSTAIQGEGKINQTSIQMWVLIRYLPLVLGDLIPDDDCKWSCFLTLHEITEILTAPVVSTDLTSYLQFDASKTLLLSFS